MNLFNTLSNAKFETKENALIDKIDIKKDKLDIPLNRIIKEKGEEFFIKHIYNVNNRTAYNVLKNLPFVNNIGRGCTKKLKELYKEEYIDKQ